MRKLRNKGEKKFIIIVAIVVICIIGALIPTDDTEKTEDGKKSSASVEDNSTKEKAEAPESEPEISEEEQLENEIKVAKKRKKKIEKYATSFPVIGMSVNYIDCTICGAHNYEENALPGKEDDYDYLYYWEVGIDDENWYRAWIKDDKVISTQPLQHEHYYFIGDFYKDEHYEPDVPQLQEAIKKSHHYKESDDKAVYEYWTAKEYADANVENYTKDIKKDKKYKKADDDDIYTVAWCKAVDYWKNNHQKDFFDTAEYDETIRNLDN